MRWVEPKPESPLPWEGYEVWRRVPELVELPPAEAGEIYFKVRGQVWRCGAFWRAMAWPGVAVVAGLVVSFAGSTWWYDSHARTEEAKCVLVVWRSATMLVAIVSVWVAVGRATLVALRRLARVEVGTHCADCDYDLRATRDRSGPRVGRCPECGRVVGERVREYGVMGEG